MKYLALLLAFVSGLTLASPSVQSSQFTAFSGSVVAAAVPAGAAGEVLFAFVAPGCMASNGLNGLVSGWVVVSNQVGFCSIISLKRVSDGTESSVSVNLTAATPAGNALVIRVAGANTEPGINSLVIGSSLFGNGTAPNAPATSSVPGSNQDVLWLTFANAHSSMVLAPSGYSNALTQVNGSAFMLAEKSNTVSWPYKEDAGAWVISLSRPWRAQTFGIR